MIEELFGLNNRIGNQCKFKGVRVYKLELQ